MTLGSALTSAFAEAQCVHHEIYVVDEGEGFVVENPLDVQLAAVDLAAAVAENGEVNFFFELQ